MIQLERVGKRFVKYEDTPMLLTAAMRLRTRTRRDRLWAVRDVDLSIGKGESVAILGVNGSGKSTLLALVAGITTPTEGRVQVRGRVAPLLSVGVGFHAEATGRENVYVNGRLLGIDRSILDHRFDEIVDFADIGDFLDTPVKFYSSGMYMRLGFAIAALVEPEVLLLDEVLAVGDLAFQLKCFDRMEQLRQRGTTIVLVTHNTDAARRLCDRAVVLAGGAVRFDGSPDDAISELFEEMSEGHHGPAELLPGGTVVVRRGFATIRELSVSADLRIGIEVEFERGVERPVIGMVVYGEDREAVYSHSSFGTELGVFAAGERATMEIALEQVLQPGKYTLQTAIHGADLVCYDRSDLVELVIPGASSGGGVARLAAGAA
jgi:ABC-type polysaccharide/polyol phosphate transport system ATPase subunit